MLVINNLQRFFLFKLNGEEIKLSDPDPEMQPEDVMNFYSALYPVLTTAKVAGPKIEDDEVQFRFVSTIGTKG